MDFAERLTLLLKEKKLNANELSKVIEVQRSTLSHLMSGRNKPSLDLIERFYTAFPDVRVEWLISGKGSMYYKPESEIKEPESTLFTDSMTSETLPVTESIANPPSAPVIEVTPAVRDESSQSTTEPLRPISSVSNRQATRTVIFFNDGSFEIYSNSQM